VQISNNASFRLLSSPPYSYEPQKFVFLFRCKVLNFGKAGGALLENGFQNRDKWWAHVNTIMKFRVP
jgi:hypothetical protein